MLSWSPRGISLFQSRTNLSYMPVIDDGAQAKKISKKKTQELVKQFIKDNPETLRSLLQAKREGYDLDHSAGIWRFFYKNNEFIAYQSGLHSDNKTIVNFDFDSKNRLKFK